VQFLKATLFLSFLVCSLFASAQNEVAINAKWNNGDTLNYTVIEYVTEQVAEGRVDTLSFIEKKLQMEVLDSAKYGYLLQWSFENVEQLGEEDAGPLLSDTIKMQYTTNIYGSFNDLVNWETIRKQIFDIIEKVADDIEDNMGLNVGGQNAVYGLMYQFNSKEGIYDIYVDELNIMHYYYGKQYEPDVSLSYDEDFPVTYSIGAVPGKGTFLLNQDEENFYIKSESETNEADIKAYYLDIIKEMNGGKIPRREKKRIKNETMFIKEDKQYSYNKSDGSLQSAKYARHQLLDEIHKTEYMSIERLD